MGTSAPRWLGVAIACFIAIPAISSAAKPLQSMPAGHLNERDLSLMQDAVVGVLEDENAKAARDWTNDASGHSGKVTALRAFQNAEGRPCKMVQIDNSAEGYKSSMRYDICLHDDGNWRDAQSGVPFGKAGKVKGAP